VATEIFKSGELLLRETPSGAESLSGSLPVLEVVTVGVFILLAIVVMKNFLSIIPSLWDSVFRARGSAALENSVRISRDRNTVASVLIFAAVLLMYKYRLWAPDFTEGMEGNTWLLLCWGVFLGYLLLRYIMYLVFLPARKDYYAIARRAGFTFFIFALIIILPVVGVLEIFSVNIFTIRTVILTILSVVFLVFLVRKCQILGSSFYPLRVFLYLCALELMPAAALVVTGTVL